MTVQPYIEWIPARKKKKTPVFLFNTFKKMQNTLLLQKIEKSEKRRHKKFVNWICELHLSLFYMCNTMHLTLQYL